MSSVPTLAVSRKAGKSGWSFVKWFATAAALAILLNLASGAHLWRWFAECADADKAEFEQATLAAAVEGQKAAQEVATRRAAYLAWLKDNPGAGAVEWQHEYQPSEREQSAMPFGGARGEQEIGTAYSGTLRIENLTNWFGVNPADPAPLTSASVSSCGATIAVADVPSGPPIFECYTDEPKVPADPPNPEWRGFYMIYRVTVAALGFEGPSDTYDVAVWLADGLGMEVNELPVGITILYEDSFEVTWAIALTGAYRRVKTTAAIPNGYTYVRDPRQLTGTGHWFADEDTEVTATASVAGASLSASANYGAGSETDLTETIALGLGISIGYNYAPDADTAYATITASCGSGDEALALDWSKLTFYKDTDSSTWHYHGPGGTAAPDAENIDWYTDPSANSVTLKRGAHGSASASVGWGGTSITNSVTIVPRLWKQNKENREVEGSAGVYRYTEYDDSEGHPFEIGRYVPEGSTAKDVSVAPSWEDGYSYTETWWYGGDAGNSVPDSEWRKLTNMLAGVQVKLRADWCKANDEDVVFTQFTTMQDFPRTEDGITYPLEDIVQPLTLHDLITPLGDPPWAAAPWVTWERSEINLDNPDSIHRPSPWTGAGAVDVTGEVWTIPQAGGTVERTLAGNVRRNRLKRMNAHLWTGSGDQQEVSDDWPLMTHHDMLIVETGDDPKWRDSEAEPWPGDEAGIDYEDVTDWRQFSCVKLQFTGVSEDQIVTLRLKYRTLSGSNPYYVGAGWKYGPENGEFESDWSAQQTADVTATLYSATGIAKFDLAQDAGESPLDLELVEEVNVIFPATSGEQTLTFSAWATVPYSGDGSDEVRVRKAHLMSDYFGAAQWEDGMPNYKPTYLYPFDAERVEVGFKHTQDAQHNPDSEITDDICSLKLMSRHVNEQLYAELLTSPTWEQSNLDAALKDADDTYLQQPYFTDYDEDGFALHVGTDIDVTFGAGHVVYCDVILQGGARGIAKAAGVRKVSETDFVTLQYSDDSGTTMHSVNTASTDAQGMYRVGSGREKTPRVYYLDAGPLFALGSFVNAEEVWAAAAALTGYPQDICQDEHDRTWGLLYNTSGAVICKGADMGRLQPVWEDATAPFGTATTYDRPRITCGPRGRLIAAATDTTAGNQMVIAVSDDMGQTWQPIAGSVLTDLQYGDVATGEHDELAVCGWHDDAIWFRLTTQSDHTADDLTATDTELEVCAAVVVGQDPPPWSVVERVTRGIWAVLVEGGGLYIVQCYGVGFAEVTGTHIADGLQYFDLSISEQDELGCVGYDSVSEDVVFRSTTAGDWTADPLDGATTELVVCDASGATQGPFCSLAAVGRGAWVAGVDDGAGELKYFRLRSAPVGFQECAT